MTEAAAAARPDPGPALQARFEAIWRGPMAGLPMLNPALQVQALGFRHWGAHWLGVLVTPWFMNLVLMPRLPERWQRIGERESRHHVFPAGVFEFIGADDEVLGDYQACSLFSPMFEFTDTQAAAATALASLEALLDPAHRGGVAPPPADTREPPPAPAPSATPPSAPPLLSKRGFLFGTPARPRGDGGG